MKVYMISITGAAVLAAAGLAIAEDARISYPSDYAKSFNNYLSLDRVQNDDQIIRLFANDIAASGAKEGQPLPEGSILVGEVYAAKKDAAGKVVVSTLGRRIPDKMVAVAVMEKRAGWGEDFPNELRNGDWDFAIFSPKGERLNKDLNACRSCHSPNTGTDHLFSIEHLIK